MLVFRSQENGSASLAKTSPDVLNQVVFHQHPKRILEFQSVPNDEGKARRPTLKRQVPLHPLPRLEKVVEANCNVGRSCGRRRSAKKDGLARGFQKVILNLVRTILIITCTSPHRVRFEARSQRRTVKIAE